MNGPVNKWWMDESFGKRPASNMHIGLRSIGRTFAFLLVTALLSIQGASALTSNQQICGTQFQTLRHVFIDSQGNQIFVVGGAGNLYIRASNVYNQLPPGQGINGLNFTVSGSAKVHFDNMNAYVVGGIQKAQLPEQIGASDVAFGSTSGRLVVFQGSSGNIITLGTPVFSNSKSGCQPDEKVCVDGNIQTRNNKCVVNQQAEGACGYADTLFDECEDTCTDDTGTQPYVKGFINDTNACSSGDICPYTQTWDFCDAEGLLHDVECQESNRGSDVTRDCSSDNICNGFTLINNYCSDGACHGEDIQCDEIGDWNKNSIACNCDCGGLDMDETGPALCTDNKDNDCDGSKDYDGDGGSPDTGCGIYVSDIELGDKIGDNCPKEGTNVVVYCSYSASNHPCSKATITTKTGVSDCTFQEWTVDGKAKFSCPVGSFTTSSCSSGEGYIASCSVAQECILQGNPSTTTVYAMPNSCSTYDSDQNLCISAGCNWCLPCNNKQYSGFDNARCVNPGECTYSCDVNKCSAICDAQDSFKLEGAACSYGCSLTSCTYQQQCSVTDRCSAANQDLREYQGTCTSGGCSFMEYNCNQKETGAECWNDCNTANGDIYEKCNDWTCSSGVCVKTGTDIFTDNRIQDCTDICSDAGNDPLTQESLSDTNLCVAGANPVGSCPAIIQKPDECGSSSLLKQYGCSNNNWYALPETDCDTYETGDECIDQCNPTDGNIHKYCYDWQCQSGSCKSTISWVFKDPVVTTCQDTCTETGDTGQDKFDGGSVVDVNKCTSEDHSCPPPVPPHKDSCKDTDTVTEWYCSGADAVSVDMPCGQGYSCVLDANGAAYCSNACDDDGDGFCETPYDTPPDCDDFRSNVCPSATQCPEQCDTLDHDCSGSAYNGFTYDNCEWYCESVPTYHWYSNGYCCGDDGLSDDWCAGSASCLNGLWYPTHCGNNNCETSCEDCSNCPNDCGVCPPPCTCTAWSPYTCGGGDGHCGACFKGATRDCTPDKCLSEWTCRYDTSCCSLPE